MKIKTITPLLIALIIGIIIGNYITTLYKDNERKEVLNNLDDVRSILIETKLKSNNDSIKYNDKIADIAAQYYRLELENRELKDKQGIVNPSGK